MKFKIWDILTIILLLATLAVGILVFQVYADPWGSLNPFPPPTLPSMLVLPTASKTPLRLPATWTPTLSEAEMKGTGRPSSTPLATSTGFVLASYTPTLTDTPTPTNTFTPSKTPTRTPVPPTRTPDLTGTFAVFQTQISYGQTATAAVQTANAVGTNAVLTNVAGAKTATAAAGQTQTAQPTATK